MFTPFETSVGALLLHQATSNLLYQNGNVLGVSGFIDQLLSTPTKETIAFFAGMAASFLPLQFVAPHLILQYPVVTMTSQAVLRTLGVALLVGWGTKISNGCTSGHMLCGLSRLSGRSTAAVATFFPVALVTHHIAHPTLTTSVCRNDVPCYTPMYPSTDTAASLIVLASLSIVAARITPKLMAIFLASGTNMEKPFNDSRGSARLATQFFSGLLFALGLHISGMTNSAKVLAFFSFPDMQIWDPSLALLLLFGVLPNIIEMKCKGFSKPPSFADSFLLPTKSFKDVDGKFVAGAAAFGVGWGLTGVCPGPAVLRAFAQPIWGLLWIGGFWAGTKFAP